MKVERFMQIVDDAKREVRGFEQKVRIVPTPGDERVYVFFTAMANNAPPTLENSASVACSIDYNELDSERRVIARLDATTLELSSLLKQRESLVGEKK